MMLKLESRRQEARELLNEFDAADALASYYALHHDPNRFFAATLGCIGENLADPVTVFEGTPPPGDGFWFLVRGVNCGGSGTYNTSGPSQPGDRDEGIGDTGADCRWP